LDIARFPLVRQTDLKTRATVLTATLLGAYLALGWFVDQKRFHVSYYVSLWMVTYSAGFVRRGLLGQMVWDLSVLLHAPPVEVIKTFQYGLAILLAAVVGVQCIKNRSWLGVTGIFVLLCNPNLIKYIWLQTGSFDILFILIPVFNFWQGEVAGRRYTAYAALFFGTIGVFTALSHEAFLFLGIPASMIISWRALEVRGIPRKARLLQMLAIFAAPLSALAVAAAFHGNKAQAVIVEKRWRQFGIVFPKNSAIQFIGYHIRDEFKFVKAVLSVPTVAVWILSTLVCFLPLIYLAVFTIDFQDSTTRSRFRRDCWDLLWIPALCSLPMYVVGSDWDRWPAMPICTAALCLLIAGSKRFTFREAPRMGLGWVALLAISLTVRLVTPNVSLGQVFTGPVPVAINLVMHRPI
jgi:hypothetical protein